jgi:hypothetical protein
VSGDANIDPPKIRICLEKDRHGLYMNGARHTIVGIGHDDVEFEDSVLESGTEAPE